MFVCVSASSLFTILSGESLRTVDKFAGFGPDGVGFCFGEGLRPMLGREAIVAPSLSLAILQEVQ